MFLALNPCLVLPERRGPAGNPLCDWDVCLLCKPKDPLTNANRTVESKGREKQHQ